MLPLIKLFWGVLLLSSVAHISFSEPFNCWYCDIHARIDYCKDNTTMETTPCDNSTGACYQVTDGSQTKFQSRFCAGFTVVRETNEVDKCRIVDGQTLSEFYKTVNFNGRRKREANGKGPGRILAQPGETYKVCACSTELCLGEDLPLGTGPWPPPTTTTEESQRGPNPGYGPKGNGGGSQGGSSDSNAERVSVPTWSFNLMLWTTSAAVLARCLDHGF